MADSMTEADWISDALGHNGKEAQLAEFKRQLKWVTGGYLDQLDRQGLEAKKKAVELRRKIRLLGAELKREKEDAQS